MEPVYGANLRAGLGEGKRGVSLVKGEALDNPFAYQEIYLDAGTRYFCRLIAEGNHAVLYFDEDPAFPHGPLLTAELPLEQAGAETAYRDEYLASGDFQIISWGGDFIISRFELTEATK